MCWSFYYYDCHTLPLILFVLMAILSDFNMDIQHTLTIGMVYLFLSFYFQTIFRFIFKAHLFWTAYSWFLLGSQSTFFSVPALSLACSLPWVPIPEEFVSTLLFLLQQKTVCSCYLVLASPVVGAKGRGQPQSEGGTGPPCLKKRPFSVVLSLSQQWKASTAVGLGCYPRSSRF